MPFNPAKSQWVGSSAITGATAATGTADGVIDDVTAAHSQTILNNNFKELQVQIDAILTALRAVNIIP
jgi:hypothetical protein